MTKRVVLITGGSGGIGKETALKFAREGDRVAIHYFSQETRAVAIKEAIVNFGGEAEVFQADLSDSRAVKSLMDAIKAKWGSVEVLINAQGVSGYNQVQDISDEEWHTIMRINLDSVFYTCRAVLPDMINRKRGHIINVSSIWGLSGAAMEVHYAAAKAGVIGFTKALAKEVGPSHIMVNCLAPGWIETAMNDQHDDDAKNDFIAQTPLGRVGTGEEMANWLWFLCSENAGFLTGQVISPNGGVLI